MISGPRWSEDTNLNAVHATARASTCQFERGLVIDTCYTKRRKAKKLELSLSTPQNWSQRGKELGGGGKRNETEGVDDAFVLFKFFFPVEDKFDGVSIWSSLRDELSYSGKTIVCMVRLLVGELRYRRVCGTSSHS